MLPPAPCAVSQWSARPLKPQIQPDPLAVHCYFRYSLWCHLDTRNSAALGTRISISLRYGPDGAPRFQAASPAIPPRPPADLTARQPRVLSPCRRAQSRQSCAASCKVSGGEPVGRGSGYRPRPRFLPTRYGGPRMRRGGPYAHRSMFATDGSHPDGRGRRKNFKNRLKQSCFNHRSAAPASRMPRRSGGSARSKISRKCAGKSSSRRKPPGVARRGRGGNPRG